MPPQINLWRISALPRCNSAGSFIRTLVAAPRPGSGPLMTRRPDRALPDVSKPWRPLRTIPLFFLIVAGSTFAIFNYQKSSSSVVSSTLYALRTNPEARKVLGDEIYFASKYPWIWGTIDQLHGKIDISFAVKGTKQKGMMKFRSVRKTRMGYFETLEWSLTTDNGETLELLQRDKPDPFKSIDADDSMAAELA